MSDDKFKGQIIRTKQGKTGKCSSTGCKEPVHTIMIVETKPDPSTGKSDIYEMPVCAGHKAWLQEQLEKSLINDWQKERKAK